MAKKVTERFAEALFRAIAVWVVVTVVVIIFATRFKPEPFALSLLAVITFAAVGCLIGFVMGIPKPSDEDALQLGEGLTSAEAAIVRLSYNNNVARFSDAVTVLLVGLSLAQFGKILDGLGWLGTKYATIFESSVFGEDTARSAYGLGLTISAVTLGAIFMFMWTSTRLLAVLRENG